MASSPCGVSHRTPINEGGGAAVVELRGVEDLCFPRKLRARVRPSGSSLLLAQVR